MAGWYGTRFCGRGEAGLFNGCIWVCTEGLTVYSNDVVLNLRQHQTFGTDAFRSIPLSPLFKIKHGTKFCISTEKNYHSQYF